MKYAFRTCCVLLLTILLEATASFAQTAVTAEAIGFANLRSATSIDSTVLGNITPGTRYPVVGRSALYPWLLLSDPASGQQIGWVYRDIVTVQGDINTVPFTEIVLGDTPTILPTATLAAAPTLMVTQPLPDANSQPTIQPTLAPGTVTGTVQEEINIRYGPGTEYQRVGVGEPGEVFTIIGRHTQFEWVQVVYPASPTGFAWINTNLLQIQGDLNTVAQITQTSFSYPTLTPTPSPVEALAGDVTVSPEFRALGDAIWKLMLDKEFDPATSRLGAFYLKNLQTGETIELENNVAFSGMSINKIAILTTLYSLMTNPPDDATASLIAEMMICSENINTNEVLAIIGNGNPYTGADRVSAFLESIGLTHTFIFTPYANDPYITPQAPQTRTTSADQQSADPDPYNQATVGELGTLLDDIYQCAYGTDSPLLSLPNEQFTPAECRQMLNTMSYDKIGNYIEAGTAAGVRIAHKHGWVEETHGDAGIVYSPGGAYIFIMLLRNPVYLEFADSEAVIEESAREVYNYFNPTQPLEAVRPPDVSGECNLLASPVISEMQRLDVNR